MHAAMDQLGAGMPCGLVARFVGKTAAEVQGALEIARLRFPVLQRRMVWLGSRPALVASEPSSLALGCQSGLSLNFSAHSAEPCWCYRLVTDGEDVWLTGVWAHAAADGPSILRLLQAIGAVMNGSSASSFPDRVLGGLPPQSRARWLFRFAFEQHLRCVSLREGGYPPGVAWLTIPFAEGISLCEKTQSECESFGAWLSAAACIAFRNQQGAPTGRVMLNLPVTHDHHKHLGGFGFGSSSLIMLVKPDVDEPLRLVARRIAARRRKMIKEGWDTNFARFLSGNPKRHRRFAALHARGRSAPMVTVSWKGKGWCFAENGKIRDIACFAKSTAVHVSSHLDQNGLSVSVTSCQTAAAREDLLRRIIVELGADTSGKILTFNGHSVETRINSDAQVPISSF
jgi:hypothetical protein